MTTKKVFKVWFFVMVVAFSSAVVVGYLYNPLNIT